MAREKFKTLTEQMYYILLALQYECCGVDIMKKVQMMTNDRIQIGPGTLYTLLARFVEANIIIEISVENGKKNYILTDNGKEVLIEEQKRLQILLDDVKKFRRDN